MIDGSRQTAPAQAFAQPAVGPAAGAEEWFVSVDEQEHGPLGRADLLEWLRQNPAGWDAYLWREGFADWALAREVHELVAAAEQRADDTPTHVVQPSAAAAAAFGSDPFGSSPPTYSAGAPASSPSFPGDVSQPVSSPGMYASQGGYGDGGYQQQAHPSYAAAQEPMIGARNENSVLFSAANLAQVAQGSSYSPAQGMQQPDPMAGHASGDASGLIDIRALAAMAGPQPQPQLQQSAAAPVASVSGQMPAYDPQADDLISAPKVFTPDTLTPVEPEPKGRPRALPAAILGVATIAAAAVVAVAFILRPAPDAGQQPATSVDSAVTAAAATEAPSPQAEPGEPGEPGQAAGAATADGQGEEASPESGGGQAAADTAEPEQAGGVAAERGEKRAPGDEGDDGPTARQARKARRQAARGGGGRGADGAAAERRAAARRAAAARRRAARAGREGQGGGDKGKGPAARRRAAKQADEGGSPLDDLLAPKDDAPAAKADKPKADDSSLDDLITGAAEKPNKPQPSKNRSVDDLLDQAVKESPPKTKKLPPQPGRADVIKAMRSVNGAVQRCAKDVGATGVATVQITVASSGRVTGANVSGITGPAGSCIARAVRQARFPSFSKPNFSVKFPFRIK